MTNDPNQQSPSRRICCFQQNSVNAPKKKCLHLYFFINPATLDLFDLDSGCLISFLTDVSVMIMTGSIKPTPQIFSAFSRSHPHTVLLSSRIIAFWFVARLVITPVTGMRKNKLNKTVYVITQEKLFLRTQTFHSGLIRPPRAMSLLPLSPSVQSRTFLLDYP